MLERVIHFILANSVTIVGLGIVSFLVGILSLPYIVGHIPVDYFCHRRRHPKPDGIGELTFRLLKNLLGAVLLLAGFVLLFTPGQGLLAILLGLMLMNYPGKYQLERWIIARPAVFRAINFLRERHGHPPLMPPSASKADADD